MDHVSIRLDAAEILDRVDDMLAWEAIASTAVKNYEWGHFMRALPLVRLERGLWGELTPSSLEVGARTELNEQERKQKNASDFASLNKMLPEFLERQEFTGLRFARLIERSPSDDFMAKLGNPEFGGGDDVAELEDVDVPDYWRGAQYHLESIGEASPAATKVYRNEFGLPQVARVFQHQHVVAFADGRAANGASVYAYWNRRFFDLNKMPLVHKMEDGREYHLEQICLADAVAEQVKRREQWTVELALGERRSGVGLSTDAIGALEIANMLRRGDTPTGRRKTLVHWVDEHMRRRRKCDEEATVKVRAHLRGKQSLDAGRYHVRIWPSTTLVAAASNGARYAGACP